LFAVAADPPRHLYAKNDPLRRLMHEQGFTFPSRGIVRSRALERRLRYIYDSNKNVTQNIAADICVELKADSSRTFIPDTYRHKTADISCIWRLPEAVRGRKLHVKGCVWR